VRSNGIGRGSEIDLGQQNIDREAVEAGKKDTLEAIPRKEINIGDIDASEDEEDIEVVKSLFPLVD
jgi:hypothetical protein